MKICFMGSMDFAVEILNGLHNKYGVDLVVTQPDKPFGRKQKLKGTPVKKRAKELKLEVYQPKSIKRNYEQIIESDFDFIIVAAYGQIIPEIVLSHSKYRAINVHASLLPKYRGGSPMHRAIINGDEYSGVTIMYMAKKMDAGPILSQEKVKIENDDNVKTLENKLAITGKKLLLKTMDDILNGIVKPKKQNTNEVSFAYNIKSEEKLLDFTNNAKSVYNKIRGLYPWPVAEIVVEGKKIKVFKAIYNDFNSNNSPGTVYKIDKSGIHVQCLSGTIILEELQLQGKKRMDANAFMNGLGKQYFYLGKII
ncbi:MAG: methionyl-tRNA formyltransferase [Candidatus Izimaplasma sp.]|nr:methionyl-tRNA formyltransferase [Candidatus Izimaplasma bacterium]